MNDLQNSGCADEAIRYPTTSTSFAYANDQQIPSTSSDMVGTSKPVMPVAPMMHLNPALYAPPCTPNYAYTRMRYSEGTRSLQGSPRPVKQLGQQLSSTPSSPMINRRKLDRIHQWNMEHERIAHIRNGGLPSSRASSIMSGMSGLSHMSNVSNVSLMSALSISTEFSGLPDISQMRSAQYSSASSCGSFSENIDPTYYLKVEQAVDELSGKMRLFVQNTEGMHANDSLRHLAERIYKLAREHDLSRIPISKLKAYIINTMFLIKMGPDNEEVEQALLAAMYIFSSKPTTFRTLQELAMFNTNLLIRNGSRSISGDRFANLMQGTFTENQALAQIFREHADEVLAVFAQRLDHRFYYCNFAAITIHTLLVFAFDCKIRINITIKTQLMNRCMQMLRAFIQSNVEHRLRERNKHIIIDIVRILSHREDSIKKYFAKENGIEMLLWFLTNEPSEQVMYYAAFALRYMLNHPDKVIAERCVSADGVKVLADKLSHGSPRLLVECSNCLSAVSDVEELRRMELSRPLLKILQILGSSEAELVKHSLGFIGNVASSSRTGIINPNKEFLVRNRAFESLLNVLKYNRCTSDSQLVDHEIIENAIFALKNLTANFSSIERTNIVRKQFSEIEGSLTTIFDHLVASQLLCQPRMSRTEFQIFDIQIENRIDLLLILQRLIDSSLTGRLFKAHTSTGISCTETLINVILQTADTKEKCTFEQQKAKLSNTIEQALNILRRLGDHPKFAQQMRPLISGQSKLNDLMRSSTSVTVSLALLRVVDVAANEPSLREQWHQDAVFMEIIRFYLAHQQSEFAELAGTILSKIEESDVSMQLADVLDERYMN
ncbi:Armadillo repeat-containing protein wrm-1 [Toxocara canis]|uniref:Armadillo repeat-containing protein wrm-1 n=1 Tax=Toxocara canis TaxID=6265 RepID=A0A0B2VXP8_TOXCA|nr:Armadillo repeat-containing protein wrm-1 [Toxocara canis]